MTDFAALDALVEQGYLTKNEFDDLVLYNYTDSCSFDKFWPVECLTNRGTIYRKSTGQIVARPYDKFFNIGEREETKLANLPNEPFSALVKEDGSMGTCFEHKGTWRLATRGSFQSDQAKVGTDMLVGYAMAKWPAGWTPIVEIIYPENRIQSGLVVNYGERRALILTGARHIRGGMLMSPERLDELAMECGFARPDKVPMTLQEMLAEAEVMEAQREGWVLTYTNGLMVKIKGRKYMEIARFMAHVNPISIWEQMEAGTIREFLKSVPEEVRGDAIYVRDMLGGQLRKLLKAAITEERRLDLFSVDEKDKAACKAMSARIFKESPEWMQYSLLQFMRGRDGVTALLKMIRPKGGRYVDLTKYGV